jgi:hypothetical protein
VDVELPRQRRGVRLLIFGALGAALLWAIATHSLVAVLVRMDPHEALAISPGDTGALLALSERALERERAQKAERARRQSGAGPAPSLDQELRAQHEDDLRRWATAVLAQEPGNARALAILGNVARRAGADDVAATLLDASARRTLHDPTILAWQIENALHEKDWPRAVRSIDAMMRYYKQSIEALSPLLTQLLENPEAAPAVVDVLAEAPSWRRDFVSQLLNATSDARVPLDLFLALKTTENPPADEELRSYLRFLIDRRLFDLAYYTWLQFLPHGELAHVGLLYNGRFERRPTGMPFDWVLTDERSGRASFERRADRASERALVLRFGQGPAELEYISQTLRLPPGRYRVQGMATGHVEGPRGLRWRAQCLGVQRAPIGESEMIGGRIDSWTVFSFDVTVPATDCAAQSLRLVLDARMPSERLVSGNMSFDDLSVARAP